MRIKVKNFGTYLIFEQIGRIPITAVTMLGIVLLDLGGYAYHLSMIVVLIWMMLPTVRMFEFNKKTKLVTQHRGSLHQEVRK